ncbi:MAG: enoyl-CoA hydratase/isomerase family protein, partial [Gammaproteobacteria bacterium]|nr:enoyl-CoA hydratase/isomerase family protein [Gammaproteobacteria bacterium]
EGPRATLLLNRPENRNGMTNRMVREAHEALTAVANDSNVRVLLLTGAGSSFCPGADLNQIGKPSNDPQESCEQVHFQVPVLLHEMPQLTLAAVNGACAGAGFGWACGCDIRVACETAMFNTAFLNVALAGDMGLPWSLPRLVGAAKARELSFFTQKFDAREAHRIGLVARVFSDNRFSDEVEELVQQFLNRSPTALSVMKAHYNAAESMPMSDYVDLETERHQKIASGKHAAEAFKAFVEKRKPEFDD